MGRIAPLLVAPVALLAAACIGLREPDPGEPVALGSDEVLVFGRVRVFEQGREVRPWDVDPDDLVFDDPDLRLSLFQVESGRKKVWAPIGSGGRFVWILPEGTYLVFHTPSTEPPWNEPIAAFQARASSAPLYVGTLELEMTTEWTEGTHRDVPPAYVLDEAAVRDDLVEARAWLEQRHPDLAGRAVPGPMVVDPELGDLFADYSRARCESLLERHGIRPLR